MGPKERMTGSEPPAVADSGTELSGSSACVAVDVGANRAEAATDSISVLTELRVERETNVALLLELSGRRAAAEFATKREEALLRQLDQERDSRRRAEEDDRTSQARILNLEHQLGLATASAAKAQQGFRDLEAQVADSHARIAAMLVRLADVEARNHTLEREIAGARTEADAVAAKNRLVADLLVTSKAEAASAIAARQVAESSSRKQALATRQFVDSLIQVLAPLNAFDKHRSGSVGEHDDVSSAETAAILAVVARLFQEQLSAASALGDAQRENQALASRLTAVQATHQQLLAEAELKRGLWSEQALQLERLTRAVAEREDVAGRLGASVRERDQTIAGLGADLAVAREEMRELHAKAHALSAQLSETNERLSVAQTASSAREASLQAELVRLSAESQAAGLRAAEAERANTKLLEAQRKLTEEIASMEQVLDAGRQAIRKLQQEVALVKLGRTQ